MVSPLDLPSETVLKQVMVMVVVVLLAVHFICWGGTALATETNSSDEDKKERVQGNSSSSLSPSAIEW